MEKEVINVEKYKQLLIKICKDLKIWNYDEIVNCYIKDKKILD